MSKLNLNEAAIPMSCNSNFTHCQLQSDGEFSTTDGVNATFAERGDGSLLMIFDTPEERAENESIS